MNDSDFGDCSTCGIWGRLFYCALCSECNCSVHAISHFAEHKKLAETTELALQVQAKNAQEYRQ